MYLVMECKSKSQLTSRWQVHQTFLDIQSCARGARTFRAHVLALSILRISTHKCIILQLITLYREHTCATQTVDTSAGIILISISGSAHGRPRIGTSRSLPRRAGHHDGAIRASIDINCKCCTCAVAAVYRAREYMYGPPGGVYETAAGVRLVRMMLCSR